MSGKWSLNYLHGRSILYLTIIAAELVFHREWQLHGEYTNTSLFKEIIWFWAPLYLQHVYSNVISTRVSKRISQPFKTCKKINVVDFSTFFSRSTLNIDKKNFLQSQILHERSLCDLHLVLHLRWWNNTLPFLVHFTHGQPKDHKFAFVCVPVAPLYAFLPLLWLASGKVCHKMPKALVIQTNFHCGHLRSVQILRGWSSQYYYGKTITLMCNVPHFPTLVFRSPCITC